MTDAELLARAIALSGLRGPNGKPSARQFAEQLLIRDERTVRRWLAGEGMPAVVRRYLEEYVRKRRRHRAPAGRRE